MILDEGDGWFRLDPRYGKGKASISMVELMKQWRKKRRQYVRSGDVWLKIPEFVTQHQWEARRIRRGHQGRRAWA